MLLLHAGNVPFEWDDATANAWPSEKPNAPFGQLPLLYHDGVRIAQSGAIARYCAKMAKLWPANDWKAEVLCDMVMEQCNDIFGLFARAKYAGDQVAQADAWDKVRNEKMPKHLGDLESLLASRARAVLFWWPVAQRGRRGRLLNGALGREGGNIQKRGELSRTSRRLRGGSGHGHCQRLRGGQRSALLQVILGKFISTIDGEEIEYIRNIFFLV